jgi:hypothetical protein
MSFGADQIFYADQGLVANNNQFDGTGEVNLSDAELKFMHFI